MTSGTRTAVASLSEDALTIDGRWATGPGSLDLCWPPSGAELVTESLHLTPGATALLRGWLPSR